MDDLNEDEDFPWYDKKKENRGPHWLDYVFDALREGERSVNSLFDEAEKEVDLALEMWESMGVIELNGKKVMLTQGMKEMYAKENKHGGRLHELAEFEDESAHWEERPTVDPTPKKKKKRKAKQRAE